MRCREPAAIARWASELTRYAFPRLHGTAHRYFAHEIIGNLLSLEPRKWRKPRRLDRRENKARVADFRKKYDRYDWTKMLAQSSDQAEVEAGPSRF